MQGAIHQLSAIVLPCGHKLFEDSNMNIMDTVGLTSIWHWAGTSLTPRRNLLLLSAFPALNCPTNSQGYPLQGDFLIYNGTVVEYF